MKTAIIISIACILLLQGIQSAFAVEACNDYVDKILSDLKEDKEYFQDPYEIPEKTIEVHKKVLLINYTGEASIYNGHIFGLSTLHRDNDVIVDKGKNTHLKIWLGAGEINLKCSGKVRLMGHGPKLTVEATVVYVNMKLDIVPTTKGTNPKVTNFKIEDVKGMEVKTSGLGPLNFFVDRYVHFVGTVFKGMVKNAFETKLKAFLNKKLKEYVIPEECIKSDLL